MSGAVVNVVQPTYTLEPGRWIYRDGRPFLFLQYGTDPQTSARTAQPQEADDFARRIVMLLSEAPAAFALLLDLIDEWPEFEDDAPIDGADLTDYIRDIRPRIFDVLQAAGIKTIPEVGCDNCGWKGGIFEMTSVYPDIPHLYERVSPGEPMPAGECPKCRALAHPLKQEY